MLFAALVVVYNKACADSPTCQALSEISNTAATVLIYDNSTQDFGNRAYCQAHNWVYLGGTGNVGLSKAYNACIAYLSAQHFDGYLCLFDDDTQITASYFSALGEAIKTGGQIFLPIIYSGDMLLSPSLLTPDYRGRLFKNEQELFEYAGNYMTAINSCMALDFSLFHSYRYDENIFLDGIDHNFLKDMHKQERKFCVFPYQCNHGFSGTEKPPVKSALVRFRIYAKDYKYILRNNKKSFLWLVGKRALHLTVQYKTLAFIKLFFNVLAETGKEAI